MFKPLQISALSFSSLLLAAIASASPVSANEIKPSSEIKPPLKTTETQAPIPTIRDLQKPLLNLEDVQTLSELRSPLPVPEQEQLFTETPVSQLSDPTKSVTTLQESQFAELTSVSQLGDVKPTDWAFTALQSLVERYGVIAGYPDRTFRGNRTLSRYEFAAGLNTALDKINEIVSAGLADKVSKADLTALKRLQEEFGSELAAIRGRVDSLEAKTAKLEAQQFSPITKLIGSATFLVGTTVSSGTTASTGVSRNSNLFFAYAANLRFNTTFTGKDLLSFTLAASATPSLGSFLGGTQGGVTAQSNVANFSLDGSTITTAPSTLVLGQLFYRFPIGDQATVWLSARSLQFFDYFPIITPLRSGNSTAATSYGLFNPVIFRPGFTNTGIGAAYRFNDQFQLHTGYFASDIQASSAGAGTPRNPATQTDGSGLFGGSSTIAAQLTFTPSNSFAASLNYIRKFWTGTNGPVGTTSSNAGQVSFSGPTGTYNAIQPFGDVTTLADTFGAQFDWRIFPKVGLGGGFTTTAATNLTGPQKANIFSASLSLGFFDLFKEGNHGGILVAITPYVSSNDNKARQDALAPWLIEAFYTHRFNKNVSITPDIFVVLNPDRGTTAEPIWGLSLRTTFTF